MLRNGSPPARRKSHANTRMTEHLHKTVDAKEVDLAALEVADPRLSYAEETSGLGLGKAS